jgi:hypothetical protein
MILKQLIAKQLKPITIDEIDKDFTALQQLNLEKVKPLSRIGNKVVDYFTYHERLNTIGCKGINFFDFIENLDKYKKGCILTTFYKIKELKPYLPDIEIHNQLFRMYFGSVSIFKPINAMKLYLEYKPTCILDFTMGFGGRLIGACAVNIPKYIGIDLNTNLENPYKLMSNFLKNYSNTEIELYFMDCLDFDYSKIEYDMVFTSPPYYNKELYTGTHKQSKKMWDENFYKPIFKRTYDNLKMGGYYCINIPISIYEKICIPLLGECSHKIPLTKFQRQTSKYEEFIYIWKKSQ